MQYLGVSYDPGTVPLLDPDFIPFGVWMEAYLQGASQPLAIAVERNEGQITVRRTFIHGTPEIRHFVKSLLNDLHLGRNQLTGAGLFDQLQKCGGVTCRDNSCVHCINSSSP